MAQGALDRQLRFTVGVHGCGRMIFGERQPLGFAVDRAGRREHQARHAFRGHRLEQQERAGQVVLVILAGLPHRLAHRQPGREVHHRVDAVFDERRPHGSGVVHPGAHERQPARGLGVARGQIVEHHHRVAGCLQRLGGVTADVAGAAGNEDPRHAAISRPSSRRSRAPSSARAGRCCGHRRRPASSSACACAGSRAPGTPATR